MMKPKKGHYYIKERAEYRANQLMEQISKYLVDTRMTNELSQSELAIRLDCSQPRISQLESGIHNFTILQLCQIAEAYGKPLELTIKI